MENNAIQIFIYNSRLVRIVEKNGESWFVGKDVAEILGYRKTADALRVHVDDEDKGVCDLQTPGGKQQTVIINESGLYSLILSSKLPTAKKFKRWVTHEVLPSIRKHGAYAVNENTQALITSLQNENALLREKVGSLIEQIKAERSYTVLGKVVALQSGIISFSEAAKLLAQNGAKTGPNKLLKQGRDTNILCKCKGRRYNQPTQKAINDGLAVLVLNVGSKGTAYLTTKGLQKLSDSFIGQIYPLLSLIERGDVANA